MKRFNMSCEPAAELWRRVSRYPLFKEFPQIHRGQPQPSFPSPKHFPIIQRFPSPSGVPCAYLKQKNLGSTRKPFFSHLMLVGLCSPFALLICEAAAARPTLGISDSRSPRASPTHRLWAHVLCAPFPLCRQHPSGLSASTYLLEHVLLLGAQKSVLGPWSTEPTLVKLFQRKG